VAVPVKSGPESPHIRGLYSYQFHQKVEAILSGVLDLQALASQRPHLGLLVPYWLN
jgi:hypothetical protein